MKETTKEWKMIVELKNVIKKIPHQNQRRFILGLYENLDEYSPFLEEQTTEQLIYLRQLHGIYC